MNPKALVLYQTDRNRVPFETWFNDLKDPIARAKIQVRLRRISLGILGDFKNVGLGIFEFRVHSGPGYRIYFGLDKNSTVVLLLGGDKSTQTADILKSTEYWQDYLRRRK